MSKPNYVYKAFLLKNCPDLIERVNKARKYDFSYANYLDYGVVNYTIRLMIKCGKDYETMGEIRNEFLNEYGNFGAINECVKILHANHERTIRLKRRIATFLNSGECSFLTLTFTNDTLSKTEPKERRVLVSRFLKQNSARYVANIDFGSKNGREHYHALILGSNVDLNAWRKHGAINIQKVHISNKDALAKYISKLTNHAIKETTKRSALIYSR